MSFILGKKLNMSQIWKDGEVTPVTLIEVSKNKVTLVRTKEKDGYSEKIGEITAQAVMQKLNKSDSAKELALIDKVMLEKKYSELLAQKEKLEEDKEALRGEIITLKSQIEYHQARLEGPVAQFRLIQEKNSEIQRLNERIGSLCLKIGNYNIAAKECG